MCYAFRDINPVADTHVLIIPKRRDGLSGLGAATLTLALTLILALALTLTLTLTLALALTLTLTRCGDR